MSEIKKNQIKNIRADFTAVIEILESKGYSILDYITDKRLILVAFLNICVPDIVPVGFTKDVFEDEIYKSCDNNVLALECLARDILHWAKGLPIIAINKMNDCEVN